MRASKVPLLLVSVLLLGISFVDAEPVTVRFTEGVTRGFPVLRSTKGVKLAQGDLVQVARGDIVESRMVFQYADGSRYEEEVMYSQRGVFTLLRYRLAQRGPSFPEMIEASLNRDTGRYSVRYRGDEDSPEELLQGTIDLPPDVYNGLLTTLLKNLGAGESRIVQIIAFTPKPRLVQMLLTPAGDEPVMIGDLATRATRYLIKPQLGILASLLVTDLPDATCWIAAGAAPGFLRFEGPLFFMGPIWRIEPN